MHYRRLSRTSYLLAACLVAIARASMGKGADLSPAKWPAADRARVEALEMRPSPPSTRLVEGRAGVVAGTLSPIAVRAGMEALNQGGTAADAAIVVALTQVATALGSYVSYAGEAQLVYFDANAGTVHSMNAGWGTYLGENDPKSIPGASDLQGAQGRKTLVPGFMSGMEAMHRRFGSLPFAELFVPAIWYAENGITVSPVLTSFFAARRSFLARTPEGNAFMHQAGDPLPATGDRFIQADAARTLRGVAQHGAQFMYTGEWGQAYVSAVRREGGKITLEDVKRYQAVWEAPLSSDFDGHTVFGPGRSTQGGFDVLEALNLVQALKVDRMKPYWKDPKAFQGLARTVELTVITPYIHSLVATSALRGGVSLSLQDRAAKVYANALLPVADSLWSAPPKPPASNHSAAVVVIDRWGNVASLVHSINTVLWGSTGIVVGGVPVSDPASFQQARLATLLPGDHVPSEMAPVIVTTNGKPTVAVAAIGESLLPETVRILVASLSNQIDPVTTMAAPPLLLNSDYVKRDMIRVPEGRYGAEFLASLSTAGMTIQTKSQQDVFTLKGTAVMGTVSPAGVRQGVEVTDVFGFAAAY